MKSIRACSPSVGEKKEGSRMVFLPSRLKATDEASARAPCTARRMCWRCSSASARKWSERGVTARLTALRAQKSAMLFS